MTSAALANNKSAVAARAQNHALNPSAVLLKDVGTKAPFYLAAGAGAGFWLPKLNSTFGAVSAPAAALKYGRG